MDAIETPMPQGGAKEIAAVLLLVFSLFFTLLAWLAATVLVWLSDYWKLSDKLIVTLVPPGVTLGFIAVGPWTGLNSPTQDWIRVPMMLSFLFVPTLVGVYLAVRYLTLKPPRADADAQPLPG